MTLREPQHPFVLRNVGESEATGRDVRGDDGTDHAHTHLEQVDARLDHGLAQLVDAGHVARMGKATLEWTKAAFELLCSDRRAW